MAAWGGFIYETRRADEEYIYLTVEKSCHESGRRAVKREVRIKKEKVSLGKKGWLTCSLCWSVFVIIVFSDTDYKQYITLKK